MNILGIGRDKSQSQYFTGRHMESEGETKGWGVVRLWYLSCLKLPRFEMLGRQLLRGAISRQTLLTTAKFKHSVKPPCEVDGQDPHVGHLSVTRAPTRQALRQIE